jgi:hypothetical protein
VALQAEQIDIAELQHVGIGSPMDDVAGLAAIDFDGRMLVHKRPLLVSVAFEADSVLGGRCPHLLRLHCPMWVVTIRALHEPLVYAVMERHLELRFLCEVAGIAKLGLRLRQQEFSGLCVVWGMARNATNIISRML